MKTDIILAGIGGQGIVLASKLLSQAAMDMGLNARSSETIGMAQRGGCVVSHVRIGSEIFSPMIPKRAADLIVAFEPAEAVRCLPYLKDGGAAVVCDKAIRPVTASLGGSNYDGAAELEYLRKTVSRLIVVSGEAVGRACSLKALNIALLGAAAAAGLLGVSPAALEEAIRQRVPARFLDMNLKALAAGAAAALGDE